MAWTDRARDWLEPRLIRLLSTVFWPPSSVVTLVERDHELLAVRFGDRYELPGGIIEHGESVEEAAQREVREETGIDVEIDGVIDRRIGGEAGSIHFFCRGTATGGELQASIEGTPEWLPLDQVDTVRWRQDHSHLHDYLDHDTPEGL